MDDVDWSLVQEFEYIRAERVYDTLLGDYIDAEPGTAICDGDSTTGVWRTQCSMPDCDRLTLHDYRLCDTHLLETHSLLVAPSRIAGAGLGLYAMDMSECDDALLEHLWNGPCEYSDAWTQPLHVNGDAVVFHRRELIGQFSGEIIPEYVYQSRYEHRHGTYVVAIDDVYSHDESVFRTALAYANDGINLNDPLRRRNYIFRAGTHVVYHDLQWPHIVNAKCTRQVVHGLSQLVALGDIRHGDEILWSYDGHVTPHKSTRYGGYWGCTP